MSVSEYINKTKSHRSRSSKLPKKTKLVVIRKKTSLLEAMEQMAKYHIHRVFVVDKDKKPIGVISHTDVLDVTFMRLSLSKINKYIFNLYNNYKYIYILLNISYIWFDKHSSFARTHSVFPPFKIGGYRGEHQNKSTIDTQMPPIVRIKNVIKPVFCRAYFWNQT